MAFLAATARHLPAQRLENRQLIQFPEHVRELIAEKAGIRARHHVTSECTSDLGAAAVSLLLAKTALDPSEIDALICATSSPDRIQPATATRIQEICGVRNAFAFDVNSVCTGAVYALRVASALVADGARNVVVVAAEVYSRILNRNDISTFPYFGDGAAAALVSTHGRYELRDFLLHSDGSGADVIQVPAGGTMMPASTVAREKDFYFRMVGRAVFEFACTRGTEVVTELARRNGVVPDRVIPHQANKTIIESIAVRSGVPLARFFVNVDRYANTAAASVLIALDESLHEYPRDQHVFLCAFGGGLSWGGAYLAQNGGAAGEREP